MGMAPVMHVLWDRFMHHDPADPAYANRDRFVLSMGHASMLLYSTLHLTGYDISLDDLKKFRQLGAKCAGHPENTLAPGVETTTGPLGQGTANSVGIAIAEKWLASHFNREDFPLFDYTTYAFCGDGDFMEGLSSEAASLAGHLGLNNLVWFYDSNRISIDGSTEITFTENVAARFQAYGWFVQTVRDVQNLDELHAAIEAAKAEPDRPSLIVTETQIGFGSPNRAGTSKAHGEPLGEEEVRLAKEAYGWDPDKKFFVPDEVRAHMTTRSKARGAEASQAWNAMFDLYTKAHPDLAKQWRQMVAGELPAGWDSGIPTFEADPKGVATRASSGKVLDAIATGLPWMMGGSADLVASTKTKVPDGGAFQKETPGGRNIMFGVREHAMAGIMNGLALSHIRPFGSSFLTFTDYCRPSIRLAALSELPCIFVFTHDSIALGEDGPTHQPIEHVSSLRAMPDLDVIRPCDANEVVESWKYIMPLTDRPVLLALTRQGLPTLDRSSKYASAKGVSRGAYVLLECKGTPDVILMGSGSEVHLCLGAAEQLTADGLKVRVVSMPCWEQFERQDQAYRDEVLPPSVRARVSVEAGVTLGWGRYVGLDGVSIGIDHYGASGPASEVLKKFGFTVENVVSAARGVAGKKKSSAGSAKNRQPVTNSA